MVATVAMVAMVAVKLILRWWKKNFCFTTTTHKEITISQESRFVYLIPFKLYLQKTNNWKLIKSTLLWKNSEDWSMKAQFLVKTKSITIEALKDTCFFCSEF